MPRSVAGPRREWGHIVPVDPILPAGGAALQKMPHAVDVVVRVRPSFADGSTAALPPFAAPREPHRRWAGWLHLARACDCPWTRRATPSAPRTERGRPGTLRRVVRSRLHP